MKCEVCGTEFQSKRATARFCSARCRVQAARVSVTSEPVSVTSEELSVTKQDLSVASEAEPVTDKSQAKPVSQPEPVTLSDGRTYIPRDYGYVGFTYDYTRYPACKTCGGTRKPVDEDGYCSQFCAGKI